MSRKGFWSRMFGKGEPGAGSGPAGQGANRPEPGDSQAEAFFPQPTGTTPAHDGETRLSGSTKSNFKTDAASDVYAQALFELAEHAGTLSTINDQVESLAELLAGSGELRELITSRALGRDDRAGVIDRVFKGKVDDTLFKFLHVLNHKDRLASLPGVTASFAALMAEKNGIIEVDAYVAKAMDAAQVGQVASSIGAALGGKQVVLHQYVDESLIGGLKLRVGDQMIDGSVATKLTKMKRDLIDAGREKARQAAGASD